MAKDLYFDTTDTNTTNPNYKRGDTVKLYKEQNSFVYPALVLKAEELQIYTVNAMKGIIKRPTKVDPQESIYTVYIELPQGVVGVGEITARDLKFVLTAKMFTQFDKRILLDSSTVIEGNMLYALCAI